MSMPPDDHSFRREMAAAYRSGWHFIDLVSAVPEGDEPLTVTLFGEPILVVRDEEEGVRAYRALRRPRGAPQPVRCAIRYGMVFVNLDQRDHQPVDTELLSATPAAPETRSPRRHRSPRRSPGSDVTVDLNTVASLSLWGPGVLRLGQVPHGPADRDLDDHAGRVLAGLAEVAGGVAAFGVGDARRVLADGGGALQGGPVPAGQLADGDAGALGVEAARTWRTLVVAPPVMMRASRSSGSYVTPTGTTCGVPSGRGW